MNHIRIDLFKYSREPFLERLSEEKIDYSEIQMFSPGTVVASGMSVMVSLVQASAPWVALSAVLVAWVKSRSSRKVIITTKDQTVVHLEGLSPSEVEKILDRAERITVIDTNKNTHE